MKKWPILLVLFLFPYVSFAKEDVTLYFFHGDGCPHCAEESVFLEKLQNDYPDLKIEKYEVWYDEENSALLQKVQQELHIERMGVPTTIIGDVYMVGYSEETANVIKRAIDFFYENEYKDVVSQIKDDTYVDDGSESEFLKREAETDKDMTVKVPFYKKINLKKVSLTTAAVVIGLIDGFNPCAMWVLLFLISVLIGMKDKKRMWILGLAFLLTSALVYALIMLSWIQIVVKMTTVISIRRIIAIAALIGGFFQLRSFIKNKDTSGCEIVDDSKRKTIFKKIRKFTSEKSFLLALIGVMGLAVSVNLVELACSAGLPLVFTELLALNDVSSMAKFWYVLLYIFFFLIDDLIVFIIAMFTMKITGITTKYNQYSHLLGGVIMLLVGVLLLLKPEWLMFQFK